MAASSITRTAISAGLLIADILNSDENVKGVLTRLFPVIAEANAQLPYACYKRDDTLTTQVKDLRGATTTTYVVEVFAKSYAESVDIAELIAEALDHKSAVYTDDVDGGKLVARSISLTGGTEGYSDDAYYQQLVFEIRVN